MFDLSQIAQAASDVASTMDTSHIGSGAIIAAATAEGIELIKRSGIKALAWIGTDTAGVNRLVGGVVAFLTGLGLSWHYDHVTGTLVINGLLAASVTHAVTQWVQQQLYYRLVIARGAPTPVNTVTVVAPTP